MRGRGYDHDVTVLFGRIRDHRGRHRVRAHRARPWRGGFRARPAARHRGAGDGRRGRHLQCLGAAVSPASTSTRRPMPMCAALAEAGGLMARGKLVHSYPHSWRSKAPLIFRATPQWFIRMDGPERDPRAKALAAIDDDAFRARPGAQPASAAWWRRGRTGASAASAPGACRSRCSWIAPPAEPLRDQAVVDRIVEAFTQRRRRCLVFARRPSASSARGATRRITSRCSTSSTCGSRAVRPTPSCWRSGGLPWPADLYLEGSRPASRLVPFLAAGVGGHARAWRPSDAVLTHGFTLDEHGRKMSKSLGNAIAPQQVWTSTAPTSCGCG